MTKNRKAVNLNSTNETVEDQTQQESGCEQKEVHQIYDKVFKRIMSLSNLAIINLINGLFGTNHPLDSTVELPRSEFTTVMLKGRFADVLIVIGGIYHYHLEAQTDYHEHIIVRVFEYGFYHAMETATDDTVLKFPEPVVIYLKGDHDIPETSSIFIDFGKQGRFEYKVENYIYAKHDVRELNRKKMIVLIPFHLLKLQGLIRKEPTKENFRRLKELVNNDILNSIEANRQCGNISDDDSMQLCVLTEQLYHHIYSHYEELGGAESVRFILPGALELPTDKLEMELEEKEKVLEEKDKTIEKKNQEIEEKGKVIEEKEKAIEEKDRELEALRAQLAALQK